LSIIIIGKKKMEIVKRRKKASLIVILLTLTMTASILFTVPETSAHNPPWRITTWAYISVCNELIGIGQQEIIVFWPNLIPPTAQGAYGDRYKWTITIIKPDGSNETLPNITSDPVGGGYIAYTPTQTGTYTAVATMADCLLTGQPLYPGRTNAQQSGYANWGDTVLGDTSEPVNFTVQQDSIQAWKETSLPTEYWARPINDMNRDWYSIASNWLGGSAQVSPAGASGGATTNYGYGAAPESAHILWATPMGPGGLADDRLGENGYQTSHYDGLSFSPPIILNGRVYYNWAWQPKIGWYCLDLNTGETLYFHNTTGPVNYALRSDSSGALMQERLDFAQILDYESPNEHGGRPYLWSTYGPGAPTGTPSAGGQTWPNNNATWMMFDAWTGNWLLNVANVSTAGTNIYGKDGSILYYNIGTSMYGKQNAGGTQRLTIWNSTHAIEEGYGLNSSYFMRNNYWCWRPFIGMTYDGSRGFSVNVTVSPSVQGSIRAIRQDQYIIGGTEGLNSVANGTTQGNLWCLSLKPGEEGKLLWNITFTPPQSSEPNPSAVYSAGVSLAGVDPDDGVFYFTEDLTRRWWGYSLSTGQQLWGPTASERQMKYYGMSSNIYKGMLLSTGSGNAGGDIVAYNITTGEVLWTYLPKQESFESPYGTYPISISCVADGKIYLSSSEHSPTQPLWRGSRIRCINATNGDEVWSINNWGGGKLADGKLVALNMYDCRIYCYGKGPSATTVDAPMTAVMTGANMVIRGTVTDIAAGAKQNEQENRFPNGVPAISDDSMTAWMEYVYMQQAYPANATGVPISIDVIDGNGNYRNIGTTKSDASGTFAYTWTPDIPGDYTVIASFEGSKSYYPSQAETHFTASGPQVTATPNAETVSAPTETYILGVGIAIIAAIVVGFAVTILVLRKRP
jgi:hypothetical protein